VIVIPAFNEDRFIGSVVLKARQYADTIIVVDDGSTDATAGIAESAGALVICHERNLGKGVALQTGLNAAREHDPEVVVTFDADGQHCPTEIQAVIDPILSGRADVVIGSRYLQSGSDVPTMRIWGHKVFNLITHLASGIGASDSQSGYRAFSPRAIETIQIASNGFSVESEMQFIVKELGLRLVEVPITIRYQDQPKRNVLAHGMLVLNGILRLVGQYRPLFFFGVSGSIMMLIGLGWGWIVVDIYQRSRQLAVGYAMISVLLTILGSLSLTTGIILHSVRGLLLGLMNNGDLRRKK
jgi:glycosyltransferase involved in cell wall biosynthesis